MQRKPNRYELPMMSIVGAMLVTVALVAAFVLVRGALRDNRATEVPTVSYTHLLSSGAQDGKLLMLSPKPMPQGWRATSARYTSGPGARWHLGILTDKGKYVGIEEARSSVGDLLATSVRGQAASAGSVQIDGISWQSWKGESGDYVLTRTVGDEAVLVRGTTSASVVQAFVKVLEPAK